MTQNFYGVRFGGLCPVQAEGTTLDGKWYYFRARGTLVSLEISQDVPAWTSEILFRRTCRYGQGPYDAGYIPHEDALPIFNRFMDSYLKTQLVNL